MLTIENVAVVQTLRFFCEADHTPPFTAKVKNLWSYTSTLPYIFVV